MNNQSAILLGIDKDGEKIYSEGAHQPPILLLAPHGSGKGVSFVLPNLLALQDSAIVHDIKGENYSLTQNYRLSIGHQIFVWNPLAKNHRYNPLDFLNLDPDFIVNDIQKISHLLINGDDVWSYQAKNLFLALVLYTISDSSKLTTIGEVFRMINGDLNKELKDGIRRIKDNIHPIGYLIIDSFVNKEAKCQQATIRSLHKYLELWANPLIDYTTSGSDFDFADFTKHKRTLYVVVNPGDTLRVSPLLQFFYQHAFQRLMHQESKHSVCFFLDDFPSIGKMEAFANQMPYFRGYKIRLLLIAPSVYEIENVYGSEGLQLIDNCPYKICFSGDCGFHDHDFIPKDHQILSINSDEPILSKKFIYYEDKEMSDRVR